MLSYVTIGANDIRRSERFYTAILCPLGYECRAEANAVTYSQPGSPGRCPNVIYVKKPYDGGAATFGNGTMFAFSVATQKLVRELHAAGREAGGSDEGAPGFRDAYSERFYVGYLRDDVGNKIALYCNSSDEPGRRA
jgi:catechol 2,3-dioxygenase-like lactoylglutathione lyase family enzyme